MAELHSMEEKLLWIISLIRYIKELLGERTEANDRIRTCYYFYFAIMDVWGPRTDCPADLNGDGMVNVVDLLEVIGNWG